jgi:hypothetical protein
VRGRAGVRKSKPDPVGLPPGGPTFDVDALSVVRWSHLDLEADDLRASAGPQDSLIILKASRDQDRNRRVGAAAPARAA